MILSLFDIAFLNQDNFLELLFRFAFNFLVIIIIVRYIYYQAAQRKDYLFTYILISTTVFLLAYLLENVTLELGFALGLFAIFGIIRYRTSTIPIKEMTYLFVIIGISIINALTNENISYAELIITNVFVIAITKAGEFFWMFKHESSKKLVYDKLELLKPENEQLFLEDMEKRTGLKIRRVEVGEINFYRNTAEVTIYYFDDETASQFYTEKALDKDSQL
ncbi:MAG: DUF4956 domain-containing protein [Bacteroidales bacterium]|mgnify:CR=1 FL=1|nr:DUF4956 domain-containing protein [Bacteroidales bacterium]MCF8386644.1 DUF4956 domain-containing protein [Bacteroidales bacterium]MCF8398920.1 DUF4956 domain-containing protein [Bacteroidales bacterium]